MRIGIITQQLTNTGGQYLVLCLARELQKLGHYVCIYTLEKRTIDVDPALLNGIEIKVCNVPNMVESRPHNQIVGFYLYCRYLFKTSIVLYRLVNNDKLDVLSPHDWHMQWPAVMVKLRRRIPVLWVLMDYWHIPGQELLPEKRILFKLGNLLIISPIDKLLSLYVDHVLALSTNASLITSGYYHKRTGVIYAGDSSEFKKLSPQKKARESMGLPENSFIFLCLNTFQPHRRFQDAIRAFKNLIEKTGREKIMLVVAGSDISNKEYSSFIKKLVEEFKLKKTVKLVIQYIQRKDVINYLAASDCLIFSNDRQTWGMVVVEAMAAGKPCIVSNGAGVSEIVKDGKTGYVYSSKDIEELSKKMLFVLMNKKKAINVGKNAREYALKSFTWSNYAKHMVVHYKKVIR